MWAPAPASIPQDSTEVLLRCFNTYTKIAKQTTPCQPTTTLCFLLLPVLLLLLLSVFLEGFRFKPGNFHLVSSDDSVSISSFFFNRLMSMDRGKAAFLTRHWAFHSFWRTSIVSGVLLRWSTTITNGRAQFNNSSNENHIGSSHTAFLRSSYIFCRSR